MVFLRHLTQLRVEKFGLLKLALLLSDVLSVLEFLYTLMCLLHGMQLGQLHTLLPFSLPLILELKHAFVG